MIKLNQAKIAAACLAVEAIGDQVQFLTGEVIALPLAEAHLSLVIINGHEDQYLVFMGAEEQVFLVVRADGMVMNRTPAPGGDWGKDCLAAALLGSPWPIPSPYKYTLRGGVFDGAGGTLTMQLVPIPGRDRTYVECTGHGKVCTCWRDGARRKVDYTLLDRVLLQDWRYGQGGRAKP